MITEFPHIHSANCETGTLSGLLRFYGYNISEPMIFGISSGLFFAYMPYLKFKSIPFISYRILPGRLINNFDKKLHIGLTRKRYHSVTAAMDDLDRIIEQNLPVGLVTNLYYLPYFPESYRFHFNVHNLIVYGKENGSYLVSDPIFEEPAKISYTDLAKARFSVGLLNLKGDLFHINQVPCGYDLNSIVLDGIRNTVRHMLTFIPLNGYRGIRYVSERVKKWPKKMDEKMVRRYLGNIIRMLEETGTGGSGFRYMYAAFLQESGGLLKNDVLLEASRDMTLAGDTWREFSYQAAVICQTERPPQELFDVASEVLYRCAEAEKKIFRKLSGLSVL
jgi:hypothetical protein